MTNNKIDFIGDVHGHADKLEWLLSKLGYSKKDSAYHHPERTALFLGDYIDRGPDNPRAYRIAKDMVEAGTAQALMGNHEYNAILFNMWGKDNFLRPHKIKNIKQHKETLVQYHGQQEEYNEMIAWFKTLPMYIESEGFSAMHACWDPASIATLKKTTSEGCLNDEAFRISADKSTDLYKAVEITCKGLEVKLPDGVFFHDKDGTKRHDIRVKWWEDPQDKTYEEMSVIEGIKMNPTPFDKEMISYGKNDKPVFFGHYWLQGKPTLLKHNICCLDYSVAKGGYMVAYRWDGERSLEESKLVYV